MHKHQHVLLWLNPCWQFHSLTERLIVFDVFKLNLVLRRNLWHKLQFECGGGFGEIYHQIITFYSETLLKVKWQNNYSLYLINSRVSLSVFRNIDQLTQSGGKERKTPLASKHICKQCRLANSTSYTFINVWQGRKCPQCVCKAPGIQTCFWWVTRDVHTKSLSHVCPTMNLVGKRK